MTNNQEPTENEIQNYMKKTGNNYYNAREDLRELAYKQQYNKPENMDWGIFWKTF